VIIRPAVDADVPRVARIHVDAWRYAYRGLLPDATLAALSYESCEELWFGVLAEGADSKRLFGIEPHRLFVADRPDREVAGFVSCGPNRDPDGTHRGELASLYLREDELGTGLGHALFEAARTDLAERKLIPFVLWVLAGNDRAIRFYERHGGVAIPARAGVHRGVATCDLGFTFA